jgi:GH24 family phage-related lysozyme (muramidase)
MTYASVRSAVEHAIRQGHLLPHQLAALTALDQGLSTEQKQAFTEDWRAAGSPAEAVPAGAWMAAAEKIVREFEGCKLTAYRCPANVPTIGWGSTTINGQAVRDGQTITQAQADNQLRIDLQRFHDALLRAIPPAGKLKPNQQAALVSWVYNVGVSAMQDSTLRKRLLAGENPIKAASEELPRWNKANGKVLPGLTRRRAAEVALFVGQQLQQQNTQALSTAQRQQWVTEIKALNLSQPDASTCQAACIGMAVGDRDVPGIRRKLLAKGEAGNPDVMAAVIRQYGRPYQLDKNASLAKCYEWLKAGEFLITHGWFTNSGHVICLDGLKAASEPGRYVFDVKDPWSEFNVQTWRYDLSSKFFDGFYSDLLIYATCVASTSAGTAQATYSRGKVNASKGGMWVHRFLAG